MPLKGQAVLGCCPWEMNLNTKSGRIPEVLTEITCLTPGKKCGKTIFRCQQMKTKVQVAYTEVENAGAVKNMKIGSTSNVTLHSGCSCVADLSLFKMT